MNSWYRMSMSNSHATGRGECMADSIKAPRILISFFVGLVACLLVAFALPMNGFRANAAEAYDPEGTPTPLSTDVPTPRATRTICVTCTPLATWTPWWEPPPSTCEPGANCDAPHTTRTPCSACTPVPFPTARGTVTVVPRPRQILRHLPPVQFGHPN